MNKLSLPLAFCIFTSSYTINATPLVYNDVQLCINAYNQLWFTFETAKAKYPGDYSAQAAIFATEFPKVVTNDFHFGLLNLPIPPNYDSVIDLNVDGINDLVTTASAGIENYGEHHVATPFSVKLTSSSLNQTKVYSMTTRDADYTRDPVNGCVVYLSQKDVVCTVSKPSLLGERKAILNSLVDNVVTSYVINKNPNQCGIWTAPPVTPYL